MDTETRQAVQRIAGRTRPSAVAREQILASTDGVPPAGNAGFFAKILGNAVADSPAQNRWKYSWQEVIKAAAGYDGWAAVSGGLSGTTSTDPARNRMEDVNETTGTQGNGVDVANLDTADYTFTLQPITTGNIVWMDIVQVQPASGEPTIEYWFGASNGVDGTCD